MSRLEQLMRRGNRKQYHPSQVARNWWKAAPIHRTPLNFPLLYNRRYWWDLHRADWPDQVVPTTPPHLSFEVHPITGRLLAPVNWTAYCTWHAAVNAAKRHHKQTTSIDSGAAYPSGGSGIDSGELPLEGS